MDNSSEANAIHGFSRGREHGEGRLEKRAKAREFRIHRRSDRNSSAFLILGLGLETGRRPRPRTAVFAANPVNWPLTLLTTPPKLKSCYSEESTK